MNLKENVDILVVNGAWNPAIILNPKWLQKHAFEGREVNFKMNAHIPLGQMPLVSVEVEGLRIALLHGALRVALKKEEVNKEGIERVQEMAFALADTLLHTPVSSYGVNFGFSTVVPNHRQFNVDTDLYQLMQDNSGSKVKKETTQFSFPYGTGSTTLNVKVQEIPAPNEVGTRIDVDINFHRPIEDLSELKAGFDDAPMVECYEYAKSIPDLIEQSLTSENDNE